jgi:DNA (cytosine-5)-methyltransferase 1
LRELALFAGAGGGILGGFLLGWRTVCAVELDSYARQILLARQRDGILPAFPIWDDVKSFDGRPWRGHVDVISGGFPCQDISCAGKGTGIAGARSGLWSEFARIISEVRPRYAFVENSPMLTSRGLHRVLGDLAELGYDAQWEIVSACTVGASHTRKRLFLVANADDVDGSARLGTGFWSASNHWSSAVWRISQKEHFERYFDVRLETESKCDGVANGVANRVDRLRAIGNGQVPAVAALAWETLTKVHITTWCK